MLSPETLRMVVVVWVPCSLRTKPFNRIRSDSAGFTELTILLEIVLQRTATMKWIQMRGGGGRTGDLVGGMRSGTTAGAHNDDGLRIYIIVDLALLVGGTALAERCHRNCPTRRIKCLFHPIDGRLLDRRYF